MTRLFPLILIIAMGSCAGIGVIAALSLGHVNAASILIWGGIGAVIGIAAAWIIARMLLRREIEHHPEDPEGLHADNPYGVVTKPNRPPE
ncbi:hypothetical protein GI374_08655 [Paracoccus sp. S-4012]|uniref:hypothetical protein n=1 Tax=Paracoccus sp. S-4012 TaxID=2665648 RepID=UPI0012B0015D|nr:hypothetical protein [Paracoccus sp. S-4012]MRX50510.1 hypothetical protein [Paracoccus sp. S-4012]